MVIKVAQPTTSKLLQQTDIDRSADIGLFAAGVIVLAYADSATPIPNANVTLDGVKEVADANGQAYFPNARSGVQRLVINGIIFSVDVPQ